MDGYTVSSVCAIAPNCTDLPEDFDPKSHPIIAMHIFGVDPQAQAETDRAILNLAFQRDVERLDQLGPRPECELLRDLVEAEEVAAVQ